MFFLLRWVWWTSNHFYRFLFWGEGKKIKICHIFLNDPLTWMIYLRNNVIQDSAITSISDVLVLILLKKTGVPEGFLANGLEWWARNPLHLSLLPPFHHDHLSNLVHLHSPHQAIKKHRDQKQKMQNLPKAESTRHWEIQLDWVFELESTTLVQIFILTQSCQYLQKRILLEKVLFCRTANLCSNQTHI